MLRSKKILSRIYRNLETNGININNLSDAEIYDEIKIAQDRIISDVFTDKIISITLQNGIGNYLLTTGNLSVDEINLNIASIKIAELPTAWGNGIRTFDIIPNKEFVETVNSSSTQTGRPKIATVIGNELKVYPIPTENEDGDEIKLYVYLSASANNVDDENEIELPNYFDKAIELYTTAQFLQGDLRILYMKEFLQELQRLKPINSRKQHTLSRPSIINW